MTKAGLCSPTSAFCIVPAVLKIAFAVSGLLQQVISLGERGSLCHIHQLQALGKASRAC